jgi:multidrug efflux pump subunit AcrA (membrane-fusion protein)
MAQVDDALAWQQQQINNFTANMPAYQQQQDSAIGENARENLQNDNASIDQNYNDRGLLYSGIKDQAKANASASEASKAAAETANANNQLNQQNYANQQAGLQAGLNNYSGQQSANVASASQNAQQNAQQNSMFGNIGLGLGTIGAIAFSDKNMKDNVESGDKDIEGFLDKIPSKKYDYKDSKNGEGKQYGLLAQDLEKHPVGKAMVVETPEGKAVDYGKGLATILATQSFLNKKMNSLKKGS